MLLCPLSASRHEHALNTGRRMFGMKLASWLVCVTAGARQCRTSGLHDAPDAMYLYSVLAMLSHTALDISLVQHIALFTNCAAACLKHN